MQIPSTLQTERYAIIAERRVVAALNRNIPPASDRVYNLGAEITVFSEQ